MKIREMLPQIAELYDMQIAGEIDEQTFIDTLEAMGVNDKIDNLCDMFQQYKADEKMLDEEIKRLAAKKKATQNGQKWIKDVVDRILKAQGKVKEKTPFYSVYYSKPKSVNITDFDRLPNDFKNFLDPTPDKISIKESLMQGIEVPGAELIENQSIVIR